ncbi:hypothetical protein GGX14DRAFT_553605 [Mycena pura]|uniref:Uncharacterized protein n=1 Tax=Mycena pura TaxID=153505 RepID=A0AAD7E5H4_9AGAR|nr:hypothetical protein GGX14DRAFT_553605 [Mycena pura]
MSESVITLRNRRITRTIPASAFRHGPQATPIQPVTEVQTQDVSSDIEASSSPPPRLVPVTDFDLDDVLRVNQLMADVEAGQFSSTCREEHDSSPSLDAYQSPEWLPTFVQDTVERQAQACRVLDKCSVWVRPTASAMNKEPVSLEEKIRVRYRRDLDILHRLPGAGEYGTAYQLYTRYRVLSRVAAEIGLDINKPAQTSTFDGHSVTYDNLFQWAQINPRSFANNKSVITNSERIRTQLAAQTRWTPSQAAMLRELTILATDPAMQRRQAQCLTWTVAQLRRQIQAANGPRSCFEHV